MTTIVNLKISKLLKRKGFNLYCTWSYWKGSLTPRTPGYALEDGTTSQENYYEFDRQYAPSIADAVMWLYEKHGIWISVQPNEPYTDNDWCFILFRDLQKCDALEGYNTPTEAYETAIEYCLTKLIGKTE